MYQKPGSLGHIFRTPAMAILPAVALLFTGCGTLTDYGKSNSNTQPQRAATPAVSDQANPPAAPGAPAAPAAPAGPALATADGDKPGIRVEVVELKRTSGDTVNLKFAMINDSDEDMSFSYDFGEDKKTSDFGTVAGAYLIDAVGKKKYFVVRDTEGACLCSRGLNSVKPKTRASLYAKFPAPPAEVEKITVVIPRFTPMDDVPISR